MNALTDTHHPDSSGQPATLETAVQDSTAGAAVGLTGLVRLMLTDFRTYEHLRLDLNPAPVVLTGQNGAGKTNILEAVSYLTAGRGLRSAKLSDVGRRAVTEDEGRPWAVAAEVETALGSTRLGSGIDPATPDRRTVHIDGKPAKGPAALAPYLSVVWLTPAMDRLFTDTPGERRRFLDRLVSVLDTEHPSRVAAFEQANRRRARLFRDGVTDDSWFNALEDTLARYGVAIAAARRDTVARLNGSLSQEDGPFPSAQIGLAGPVDDWLNTMAAVDAEDALRHALAEDRKVWSGAGDASGAPPSPPGPNRSDLMVTFAATGRPAADCSTGEQKALLVSIILAHVRLQTALKGQPPILLLDEVAAHLDPERRRHLFDCVTASGAQAWMTGTEASVFSDFGGPVQMFTVADGQVKPTSAFTATATVLSHPKLASAQSGARQ